MIFIIINWTDKQTVRKLFVTQVCFSSNSCRRGDECKTQSVSVWSELETWHVMPSVPHISHILHSKLEVHSTGWRKYLSSCNIIFEIFILCCLYNTRSYLARYILHIWSRNAEFFSGKYLTRARQLNFSRTNFSLPRNLFNSRLTA